MATTIVSQMVWPSSAIPIPKPTRLQIDTNNKNKDNSSSSSNNHNHHSLCQQGYPTTPSLQSILDQKKFSNGSIRSSVSSNSVPSMVSTSSSYESCDSHPLDSFNTWDDIDENFFCNNDIYNDVEYSKYSFQPVSPIEPELKSITKKTSFVSNLSSSIKSFANSTRHNNDMLLDIQPRLTDDKLPKSITQKKARDTELETFKITSQTSTTATQSSSNPTLSILRNREPRINSQFLRLYSYESNSRRKGILPEVSHLDEEEYIIRQQSQSQSPSSSLDPSRDFALFVRQRLWQCVVLPPREDLNISQPEYVYAGEQPKNNDVDDDNDDVEFVSLIRKNGDVKPWIKLEDEEISKMKVLRPCGVLNNDTQFTVKGWCNERWLPRTC